MSNTGNLFRDSEPPLTGERFEALLERGPVTVERILSSANTGPTDYCQPYNEWVVLLEGTAELEVDGDPLSLERGDYLFIPAETPHTVVSTSGGALWLAIKIAPG
jgi:cupin 2 domain-containing protein